MAGEKNASNLRRRIKEKANLIEPDAEIPVATDLSLRSRKGLKHSTRADNTERLLEKEIKMRIIVEAPTSRKYKA